MLVNTNDVEDVIKKACRQFRLGAVEEQYTLLGNFDGDELEVTDDILKTWREKEVLKLSKISDSEQNRGGVGTQGQASANPYLCECKCQSLHCETRPLRLGHMSVGEKTGNKMNFVVRTLTGKHISLVVYEHETLYSIKLKVQDKEGIPPDHQVLKWGALGRPPLCDNRTLGQLGVHQNDFLYVTLPQRGGKPVIYLFPPTSIPDVTVSVRLVPQWNFSHIYPVSDIKSLADGKHTVTWSVSASPSGALVEKSTGLELSYLFWEALSKVDARPSPPLSPVALNGVTTAVEHFDPALPSLEPSSPTAVILPFTHLLPYLDSVLKSLTLHVAARNDFIAYWLPALSKKPYVAMRFLPQAAYERAAALEVIPAPDVVTRVFMLFRGVAEDEIGEWCEAHERAGRVNWVDVVGVTPRALDMNRFRVLEWGGMEVV
ncbi:hypothetical protein C8T65DRAFT_736878 [Cerioporus squamosus]|nr:hypothetical protein C8T65DRAFT_736878 [Cerioporus squamosus]